MNPSAGPVAVIGGGPAGLMAAEVLNRHGLAVEVYEANGSVGRKFLLAGKGGLNLTHAEPFEAFVGRYRERSAGVSDWLHGFDAQALRAWALELGVETFIGSSGRVFPSDLKAAPLLRRWLRRLRESGVRFQVQHRWRGWSQAGELCFQTESGERRLRPAATVLALGGASWPQLGSDGAWVALLAERGIQVAPLNPANVGFEVAFSPVFVQRFAGSPVKPVVATIDGDSESLRGEFMVSAQGVEGGLIYALGARLREQIEARGEACLWLDLAPDRSEEQLTARLASPRDGRSLTEHLRRRVGIEGVKAGLLREAFAADALAGASQQAAAIKHLPLRLLAARPIAEAISSAGGVRLEVLDKALMVCGHPGLFCAGEMLDWEAPTGGYLLQACLASGRVAGLGAAHWLLGKDCDGGHINDPEPDTRRN